MRSSATRGTGQLRLNSVIGLAIMTFASAILIVSRARALRRDHGRAKRILRRALHRKRRTLVGLLDPLQNQPANALRRLVSHFARERKAPVGIMFLKSSPQLKSTRGYFSQATPLPVHHLKH